MDKDNNQCPHTNCEQEGVWDGKNNDDQPFGGPIIHCEDCDLHVRMTWEEYKSIPRRQKQNRDAIF